MIPGPICFQYLHCIAFGAVSRSACYKPSDMHVIPRIQAVFLHRGGVQSPARMHTKAIRMAVSRRDDYYNLWTYDEGSKTWQDEYGGKIIDQWYGTSVFSIHTPDGKIWGRQLKKVQISARGEVTYEPNLSSGDLSHVWVSSSGDLTLEWPSRRWQRLQASEGASPAPSSSRVVFDMSFNRWTYDEDQKAWLDDYGGQMTENPKFSISYPLITSDGKVWQHEDRFVWKSKSGQIVMPNPDTKLQGGDWEFQTVSAWYSSNDDVCLGWPSKELKERLQARPASALPTNQTAPAAAAAGASHLALGSKTSWTAKVEEAARLLAEALAEQVAEG